MKVWQNIEGWHRERTESEGWGIDQAKVREYYERFSSMKLMSKGRDNLADKDG